MERAMMVLVAVTKDLVELTVRKRFVNMIAGAKENVLTKILKLLSLKTDHQSIRSVNVLKHGQVFLVIDRLVLALINVVNMVFVSILVSVIVMPVGQEKNVTYKLVRSLATTAESALMELANAMLTGPANHAILVDA
jgi:hypothetical protein